MAMITEQIRQANIGRKILRDWLGADGVPVPIEQAQARANVCLNCPKNDKGQWIWSTAASALIGMRLRLRTTMNIHLQGEDDLGVCDACGCVLRLKLHTPYRHIARHTTPEMISKYPDACWLKQETKNNH